MFEGMHNGWMWGMHWLWWGFWLLVIVGLIWTIARSQQSPGSPSSRESQESPLEVLQRRYAEGELSTDEYEERKERLEGDQ